MQDFAPHPRPWRRLLGAQDWSGFPPLSSPSLPGPRTHISIHQHVKADAESLQECAVLTAVLHLVVFGEPEGQRCEVGPTAGSYLNLQGPLEPTALTH